MKVVCDSDIPFLKGALELGIVPLPDHGAGFRHGLSALALRKRQVAVAVGATR